MKGSIGTEIYSSILTISGIENGFIFDKLSILFGFLENRESEWKNNITFRKCCSFIM